MRDAKRTHNNVTKGRRVKEMHRNYVKGGNRMERRSFRKRG